MGLDLNNMWGENVGVFHYSQSSLQNTNTEARPDSPPRRAIRFLGPLCYELLVERDTHTGLRFVDIILVE